MIYNCLKNLKLIFQTLKKLIFLLTIFIMEYGLRCHGLRMAMLGVAVWIKTKMVKDV